MVEKWGFHNMCLVDCYEIDEHGHRNVIGKAGVTWNLGTMPGCRYMCHGVGRTESGKWFLCHVLMVPGDMASLCESIADVIPAETAKWLVMQRVPEKYAKIFGEPLPKQKARKS